MKMLYGDSAGARGPRILTAAARFSLVALLSLMMGVSASAENLQVKPEYTRGISLVEATVPKLIDGSSPGSWLMVRLHLHSDSGGAPAVVTLSTDSGESWSAQSDLKAFGGEVDVAVPASRGTNSMQDDPAQVPNGTDTDGRWQALFHYTVTQSGSATAGLLSEWDSYRAGSVQYNSSHMGATDDGASTKARCVRIGYLHGESLFQTMSPDDMESLADHAECLDQVKAILVSPDANTINWEAKPGIAGWVRTGGLLIEQKPGASRWTSIGSGAVVEMAAVPTADQLARMSVAVRRTGSFPDDASAPAQHTFPGYDAPELPIFIALALYVVLLLPVNYFMLRRMRRKEASWLTVPSLAVFFSLVLAVICYGWKGVTPVAGRVTLLDEPSPGVYSALGYISIFSSHSGRFNVSLPPETLPLWAGTDPSWRNPNDVNVNGRSHQVAVAQEGMAAGVEGLPLLQWCSNTIGYRFSPQGIGAITGTASYSPNTGWVANVQNYSSLSLEQCQISVGGRCFPSANLPAGGAVSAAGLPRIDSLSLPATDEPRLPAGASPGSHKYADDDLSYASHHAPSFRERVRAQEMDLLQVRLREPDVRPGVYLIGWSTQPVQAATADGIRKYLDETLVVVPLEIVAGPQGLEAPEGTLEHHLFPGDNSQSESSIVRLPSSALSHPDASLNLPVHSDEPIGYAPRMAAPPAYSPYSGATMPARGGGAPGGAPGMMPAKHTTYTVQAWNAQTLRWVNCGSGSRDQSTTIRIAPIGPYESNPVAGAGGGPVVYLRCSSIGGEVPEIARRASLSEQGDKSASGRASK